MIRAVSHGEQICQSHGDDAKFRIQGKMWQQLGNMGKRYLWNLDELPSVGVC